MMVMETLLPLAAVGAAGAAYGLKRKVFPAVPDPDDENFVLPLSEFHSADAEDVDSPFINGLRIPRRTLLTLGASGSGKSETLKHFADQLRTDQDSQIVVYDHKRDYQEFFEGATRT